MTDTLEKITYECSECEMVILFFTNFTMLHLGREHHGFTWQH